jgi:hypothetical protein
VLVAGRDGAWQTNTDIVEDVVGLTVAVVVGV